MVFLKDERSPLATNGYNLSNDPKDDMACHISKVQELSQRLSAVGESISDSVITTQILMIPQVTVILIQNGSKLIYIFGHLQIKQQS